MQSLCMLNLRNLAQLPKCYLENRQLMLCPVFTLLPEAP